MEDQPILVKRVTRLILVIVSVVAWRLADNWIYKEQLAVNQSVVINFAGLEEMRFSGGAVDLRYASADRFAVLAPGNQVVRSHQDYPPVDWPRDQEYHVLLMPGVQDGTVRIVEKQTDVSLTVLAWEPATVVFTPWSLNYLTVLFGMAALVMCVSFGLWAACQIPIVMNVANLKPGLLRRRWIGFVFSVTVVAVVIYGFFAAVTISNNKYQASEFIHPDVELTTGEGLALDRSVLVSGAASEPFTLKSVDQVVNSQQAPRPDGWPDPQYYRLPEGTMLGPGVYTTDVTVRLTLKPDQEINYTVWADWLGELYGDMLSRALKVLLVLAISVILAGTIFSLGKE